MFIEDNKTQPFFYYKNQQVDYKDIPDGDVYQCCLVDDRDQSIILISTTGQCIHAIEVFDKLESNVEVATEAVRLALNNNFTLEPGREIPVMIHVPLGGLEFKANEGTVVCAKECFQAQPGWAGEHDFFVEPSSVARFCVEESLQQPEGLIFRRAGYNANKQLLNIDYPLYYNNNNTLEERYCFREYSTAGEQLALALMDDDDKQSLASHSMYLFPADTDPVFHHLLDYVDKNRSIIVDSDNNPVSEDQLPALDECRLLSFSEQKQIKTIDLILNQGFAESEIFDVPIDYHWHIFHLYLRLMHQELKLLSHNYEASHYIKIHSPKLQGSIGEVQLDNGMSRVHTTTFHMEGNLISHDCAVFDSAGNLIKAYLMESPASQNIVFEYSITDNNH